MLGLIFQSFWFIRSGVGLIICISNKFTEDIDATGLEITLWEQCPLSYLLYLILPCFDGTHFPEERFVECMYFTFHYGNFQIYAKIINRMLNSTYHYSASTVINSWLLLFHLQALSNIHPPKWIILKQIQQIFRL